MNTPYENNGADTGSERAGSKEISREDLVSLIERVRSNSGGIVTTVEAFQNQGWLRITIKGEKSIKRRPRKKESGGQASTTTHVSMDRETMEQIAIITHSPEVERIFVGSNPFRAEIISQEIPVNDQSDPFVKAVITISTPRIDTRRFDKVAPCYLCGTQEERRRRVDEDNQRPIPVDRVETGFHEDQIDHTVDPTVLTGVRRQRDSLAAMLEVIDSENHESIARSKAMAAETIPVLEQPKIQAKLRELEEEIRGNPFENRQYGENLEHLLFRNRTKATQILREIFEILLESRIHGKHITSSHQSISDIHMCMTITEELKPLIMRIASITGSREKAEKKIERMQAKERKKETRRKTSLILFRSRSSRAEPEEVMDGAIIELI